jgi:hypothetical protein
MEMIVDLIANTLVVCTILASLTNFARGRYAKGTRQRYILTTIEWALIIPGLLSGPWYIFFGLGTTVVMPAILFLLTVLNIWFLWRDDDDNWFRKTRNRIKNSIRVHNTALAGSRA